MGFARRERPCKQAIQRSDSSITKCWLSFSHLFAADRTVPPNGQPNFVADGSNRLFSGAMLRPLILIKFSRLMACIVAPMEWQPIETAPFDLDLELAVLNV
jgi:hypothetical protein